MQYVVANGRVHNPEGLEVNATLHCNMRCTSCSHLSPLFRRETVDATSLHETLSLLAKSYHAKFVKVLGGEPLLHPDLLGVIEAVKSSGVADSVLVCTNGTLLDRTPTAFWEAVDAVEISVYPSRNLDDAAIRGFAALAREHEVELIVNRYSHFRVAYSEHGTDSPALVQDIYDTCKLAHVWLAHTVFDGWLYRCPQSVFLPAQLTHGWDRQVDGLEIADDPGFVAQLLKYLGNGAPLNACRNCLGSVGKLHPHAEVPRAQWRQELPTEEVIDRDFLAAAREDIALDDGCCIPVV